jgi:hypothetical protein
LLKVFPNEDIRKHNSRVNGPVGLGHSLHSDFSKAGQSLNVHVVYLTRRWSEAR